MGLRVYDAKNPQIKWCLERIFGDQDFVLVSTEYMNTVHEFSKFILHYGLVKEAFVSTIEEYTATPFNLYHMLQILQKRRQT